MASEWEVIALGDAGVTVIDCVHKTPKAAEQGLPYVAIPQMKTGVLDLSTARRITRDDFEAWTEKALPQPFDVVLSRRCNPGVSAVVPPGMTFALGQNLVLLRSDGQAVYPPYLTWMVRSHYWWAQIGKFINVGAVFDSLRCRDIPKFQLPLPPLPEQRRIAAVLGALDDKIELNRKMNRTLEAMAQALFKSWFIDFDGHDDLVPSELGPIPRGWEVAELQDLIQLDKGLSYKSKHFDPEGIPMVNLKCIARGGGFQRRGIKYYAGEYKPRHIVEPGDIVVAMTDLTQDRVVIASPAFVPPLPNTSRIIMSLDLSCPRLPADSVLSKAWLYYRLQTRNFKEFARGFANGTTVMHLKLDGIKRYRFALPPAQRISAFTSHATMIRQRIDNNTNSNNTLAALRDTLLPRLISGEIRVPEAEDALQEAGL